MKRVSALLFLVSLLSPPAQPNKSLPAVLAIIHAAVIDATGSPASPDMTVVITGARITDIGKTGKIRYAPDFLKESWKPQNYDLSKAYTGEDLADAKMLFQKRIELIGAMRRAGVKLLTGTDSPTAAYTFAGFSLHDELALMVRAGLTPMEALQAATRNPARFFGLQDSLGAIERGKIADLVLLDANPLLDIRHTQKINAVIINGRLLDRTALDDLLAKAAAAGQNK